MIVIGAFSLPKTISEIVEVSTSVAVSALAEPKDGPKSPLVWGARAKYQPMLRKATKTNPNRTLVFIL
jgi:hypothetical protein